MTFDVQPVRAEGNPMVFLLTLLLVVLGVYEMGRNSKNRG